MKRLLTTAVLGIALCLAATALMAASTFVTGPVNKAGFQALIDGASPGDTILCLGGIYDFSDPGPVWFDKGLTIKAADPADPPVFRGDGSIYTPFATGNNGFAQAYGSFVDGLTMQGLVFEDMDRSVSMPSAFEPSLPGCPLYPDGGVRKVKILDNTVRDSRRGFQIYGGPADDFVFRGNDFDLIGSDSAFLIVGGALVCADGSIFDAPRPTKGTIQGNHIRGDHFGGIWAGGVERLQVKENLVEGGFLGILFFDDRAFYFGDDGPIRIGQVKENVIEGALFGIYLEGTTTITDTQIKDNQISGGLIGVLADFGANGFEIKANEFSGIGFAEVYLGLDEDNLIPGGCGPVDSDPWACAPETYNNVVKVYEGDLVLDFGTDNEVKFID